MSLLNMNKENNEINFESRDEIPAEDYEKMTRKFIPGYDGLYSLAQILLAEDLPENAEILIIGAGGGKEITMFGKAFSDAKLTGVDPSEKMLGVANELAEQADLQSRVTLQTGTIEDVEEKQFDAATALLVMHFLPDNGEKLEFLKAIYSRLKKGAKFIIADGCYERDSEEFDWLLDVYKKHARLNGVSNERLAEIVEMIKKNVNTNSEERELELLREANFGEIKSFFQGLWFRAWIATRL